MKRMVLVLIVVGAILMAGPASAQPAATEVAAGTIYGVTDESVVERSNGTTWDPFGTW